MYRVCLTKDGKLIEMQSGGVVDRSFNDVCNEENQIANNVKWDALEAMRLNTLKQNAINAGYKEEEIEVKWVNEEEWLKIQEANKPIPTYADLRRPEYPQMADYFDAKVKQSSGDPVMQKAGIEQEKKYYADCLAVKAKYPKSI